MIHHLRALAERLRNLFGDRSADQELDDEIEARLPQGFIPSPASRTEEVIA
jgi:hypothetical protein